MLTVPAPVSAETLAERIGAALRGAWADQRHATKRLSRRLDADPRAVENWMAGRCAPRAAELVRLMAECDAVRVEIETLIAEARAARAMDPHV